MVVRILLLSAHQIAPSRNLASAAEFQVASALAARGSLRECRVSGNSEYRHDWPVMAGKRRFGEQVVSTPFASGCFRVSKRVCCHQALTSETSSPAQSQHTCVSR